MSALAKKPEGRPADLRAFAEALVPFASLDAAARSATSSSPGDSTGPLGPGWTQEPTLMADSAAELRSVPPPEDPALPATRAAIDLVAPEEREAAAAESDIDASEERPVAPERAEPTPPRASDSSGASPALWVGVAVLVAAAVGTLAWWNRPSAPSPPAAPQEVHVRVRVSPADATVEIDGVRFDNPVEAQRLRSLSPVQLRIQHPGYEPVERMVVFDEDRAYDIQLAPLPPPPAPDAAAPRPTPGAPRFQPRPVRGPWPCRG